VADCLHPGHACWRHATAFSTAEVNDNLANPAKFAKMNSTRRENFFCESSYEIDMVELPVMNIEFLCGVLV